MSAWRNVAKKTLSLCVHIVQHVISKASAACLRHGCLCIYYLRINISNPTTFWKDVYPISSVENEEPLPWMLVGFLCGQNGKPQKNKSCSHQLVEALISCCNLKWRNLLHGWCCVACFDAEHRMFFISMSLNIHHSVSLHAVRNTGDKKHERISPHCQIRSFFSCVSSYFS